MSRISWATGLWGAQPLPSEDLPLHFSVSGDLLILQSIETKQSKLIGIF